VGGLNNGGSITSGSRFLGRAEESCYSLYEDVEWLSETPSSGIVTADSNGNITVTFDATNLTPGTYNATLVILTNDAGAGLMRLPVTLTVTEAGPTT
jgi:hypothetical protein